MWYNNKNMRHRKEKEDKVFECFYWWASIKWSDQLQHIQNKIAKNTGVINKRHFVSIHMLKQLYYTLIYPYLIMVSWVGTLLVQLDWIK
jgi:hypothetical protein